VNHHHLLAFAEHATQRLIWVNFAHLFHGVAGTFSTAWVADTKLAAVRCRLCSSVCTCQPAYIPFEWHALASAPLEEDSALDATIRKNPLVIHIGDLRIAMLVALKFLRWLWIDLPALCWSICGRKPWIQMKMRATL